MKQHIKQHPIALLAVLVGVILIFSVTICVLALSGPSDGPLSDGSLPEKADAANDENEANPMRVPADSQPELNNETTVPKPSESMVEEPTIGTLETSALPEESLEASDDASDDGSEEASSDEASADTASQPEEGDASEPSAAEESTEPEPELTEEYTLRVRVTNLSGDALAGANVVVGSTDGKTDANGCVTVTVTDPEVRVRISLSGYRSYDKTVTLSGKVTEVSAVLSEAGDSIRSMMNALELRPYRTNIPELNAAVEKILGEITTPEMDTYDQVLACYDWIMETMYYRVPSHKVRGHWACAYQAYENGYGACNCYTALFIVLTRYIGLETYCVEGNTAAYGGGMTFHYWTVLEMGGEYYIFDPQVEDQCIQRTSSKKVTHDRFCLKEPSVKYVYKSSMPRSTCIKNFEAYLLENGRFVDP